MDRYAIRTELLVDLLEDSRGLNHEGLDSKLRCFLDLHKEFLDEHLALVRDYLVLLVSHEYVRNSIHRNECRVSAAYHEKINHLK